MVYIAGIISSGRGSSTSTISKPISLSFASTSPKIRRTAGSPNWTRLRSTPSFHPFTRASTPGTASPVSSPEREGRVFDCPGQNPGMVDAVRAGEHAFGRDEAMRRLEPHHAADARRIANGAAVVRSHGERRHPRRHLSRRASARSARRVLEIPGILHVAVVGVLSRLAAREFVQVGLSHENRSRLAEPSRDLGVRGRKPACEEPRSRRRGDACGIENVLQADGDSVKRPLHLTPRSLPIGLLAPRRAPSREGT